LPWATTHSNNGIHLQQGAGSITWRFDASQGIFLVLSSAFRIQSYNQCAMVSNSTLAALCVWSGIYEFVDPRAHRDGDRLEHYASLVRAKHWEETESSQRENRHGRQYWSGLDCPKVSSASCSIY
jgi:hypothetical protein